jgi:hypothetical protein
MYAASSTSSLHHLANNSGTATLCGLRVVPIIINRPTDTAALNLTEVKGADVELCGECAELASEEED